ncbi:MAG: LPP20 family lipoprotein, partial [Nitrospiraceae bacterium]
MFLAVRWTSILIILCVLSSCTPTIKSEPDALRDLTPPTEPQKGLFGRVRQQYPSDRYLIGIGQPDLGKAATELARADLMKQVRVEVRVMWTDLIRERGGKTEQEVSRLVETEVAELVRGIEIVEQGRDRQSSTAYAVAVLPKAEMESILQKPRGLHEASVPPSESREPQGEIWVIAEGIVSLGDDITIAEAKARSRDEARRKAIEQAVGIFVKGQRMVYNAQLAEDLVRSL